MPQPPICAFFFISQIHLFTPTFSVKHLHCSTAALCPSLLFDLCWFLIETDSCILRDRNITSIKNSSFCLSANAVGNLTKLINMTVDNNKTYVSPSEEYFKWVNLLADEKLQFKIEQNDIRSFWSKGLNLQTALVIIVMIFKLVLNLHIDFESIFIKPCI